jgi:tRNA (guanine37-N1)-methyltransferase
MVGKGNVNFTIVTIFPEFFSSPLEVGLLGKAIETGLVEVDLVQLREFTSDRHRSVDDAPYGGGPGMVMMLEPLVAAMEHCQRQRKFQRRILFSPRGRALTHSVVRDLVKFKNLLFVCGRYEGVDERLIQGGYVDDEISLGDFVLNGGEVAALAAVEACSRLLPGAMGNDESVPNDSFYNGLLDHPHFTRPRDYLGQHVPDVLLSGNHAAIDRWRRGEALRVTRQRRPDLLAEYELSREDRELLEE